MRFGCGVDDVAELAGGKLEAIHAAGMETQARLPRQMRHFSQEGRRIARQDQDLGAKVQLLVGPEKCLDQPHPKEARSARS